jgi:glutamate/tyrosine decarboxylase-like PLP-dependent enzyme
MSLAWQIVARRLESWPRRVRDRRPRPTLAAPELARRVAALDPARPHDLAALVEEVADLLEGGTLHNTHPRFFGLFVTSVRPAGIVGGTLAALYNPQVAAAWHAPAASAIEEAALDHLRRLVGFPDGAHASFTSGGSEANFSGILAALAHAFPEAGDAGLAALPAPPVFYASDQAHDSFLKIAHAAGLGRRALRRVPSDGRQRLDVAALRAWLAADRAAGRRPFCVVATCGTTATGAIDPVDALADLCAAEGLWLHVDAAWGGLGLLSPRLRPPVAALARADSVTWDAHKTLPVPMGAGMFFCRHRGAAEAAHQVRAGYVPDGAPGARVPYRETLQWSRRAIGLKVFLALAELGAAGVAALVDAQAALADRLRAGLAARGLQVTNDTPLPLVCFVDERVPAETLAAVDEAWISTVRLPSGERWARACITHVDSTPDDVDALVDAVASARDAALRR